jgi:competence protein ComEA
VIPASHQVTVFLHVCVVSGGVSMVKKKLLFLALFYAVTGSAAVDVNTASEAELDGIKGIGPGISTPILEERKKGDFKDWNDLIVRVKKVGKKNAATFSKEGLTVGGVSYPGQDALPRRKASAAPKTLGTRSKQDETPK